MHELGVGQLQVLENLNKNLVVNAMAGAGKTYIIGKALNILQCKGNPVCLTFTRKAAEQVKSQLTKGNIGAMVKTIDAIYYHLFVTYCEDFGYSREGLTILENAELIAFCQTYELFKDCSATPSLLMQYITSVITAIADDDDDLTIVEASRRIIMGRGRLNFIGQDSGSKLWINLHGVKLVTDFLELVRKENIITFELIRMNIRMYVQLNPNSLANTTVTHLILDEFQDLHVQQFLMLRKLYPEAYVLCFGDINQAVYSWRGVDVHKLSQEIARLDPLYIQFTENYRHSEQVAAQSQAILRMLNETGSDPLNEAMCGAELGYWICKALDIWHAKGESCAILCRTNFAVESIARRINTLGNYVTTSKDFEYLKSGSIQNISRMLCIALNINDTQRSATLLRTLGIRAEKPGMVSDVLDTDWNMENSYYTDLLEAYEQNRVVVLDSETTGLSVYEDRVIQVAALWGQTGEYLNEYILPDTTLTMTQLENVHHISLDTLNEKGVALKTVLEKLHNMVDGNVLVGQNIVYDLAILNEELTRCEMPAFKPSRVYDTLKESIRFLPALEDHKLDTIRLALGIEDIPTHDALADIITTNAVMKKLIEGYIRPNIDRVASETENILDINKSVIMALRDKLTRMRGTWNQMLNEIVRQAATMGETEIPDKLKNHICLCVTAKSTMGAMQQLIDTLAPNIGVTNRVLACPAKSHGLTIHGSKGCEFDNVIIIDEKNDKPKEHKTMDGHTEEVRLVYVALSRARKRCLLITDANDVGDTTWLSSLLGPHAIKRRMVKG